MTIYDVNGDANCRPSRFLRVPIEQKDYNVLHNLLANGCRLFYQKGKKRPSLEIKPLTHDELSQTTLLMPEGFDSLGLDLTSLKTSIAIIDIDKPTLTSALKRAISELDFQFSVEQTPSGGLHIWGLVESVEIKTTHCACGVPIELFTSHSKDRITIWGAGRKIVNWVPLSDLGLFSGAFKPVKRLKPLEIVEPILEENRWNTLYKHVAENPFLDEELLNVQATYLCEPSFDEPKLADLAKILLRRKINPFKKIDEESLEFLVSVPLAEKLKDKWVYRLPEERWYKYKKEGYWTFEDSSMLELINDIVDEIKSLSTSYSLGDKRKMLTLHFCKLIEKIIRLHLFCKPESAKGLHFVNGLLDYKEDNYTIISPLPGFWLFTRCNVSLHKETKLTSIQKDFLLNLMDGDILKINILRAYLKLLFTQNNREQVCLYLWGPGSTGKSTLTQLLQYILGNASCTLDLLRITNRFELKVIQDKDLILMPDIPKTANQKQCSIIKKIISGDRVVGEIKNGSIFEIEPRGLMLITANFV
uniref:hypothetical protein n=1 Tax=Mankyua chejuensis TaxID=996148 RepID=UPI00025701E8|nr:hypothetical protein MACHC_p034 [Mankyua chejuensis]